MRPYSDFVICSLPYKMIHLVWMPTQKLVFLLLLHGFLKHSNYFLKTLLSGLCHKSYRSFENRDALWYCIGDRTKKSFLGIIKINIKINFLR